MKKIACLISLSLLAAVGQAQLSQNASKALSLSLAKAGQISLVKNPNQNLSGFPIGLGYSSRLSAQWVFDCQFQYGIWKVNQPPAKVSERKWFDAFIDFQKLVYSPLDDRLTINAMFGLGYTQYHSKSTHGGIVPVYQSNNWDIDGGYGFFGAVANVQLSKRIVLYNKAQLKIGIYRFHNRNSSFDGLEKNYVSTDFCVVPIEFGISYNFSALDEN